MKARHIFLTLIFAFLTFSGNAQSKFEFIVIEYHTFFKEIGISINGGEFKTEEVLLQKGEKSHMNANP